MQEAEWHEEQNPNAPAEPSLYQLNSSCPPDAEMSPADINHANPNHI